MTSFSWPVKIVHASIVRRRPTGICFLGPHSLRLFAFDQAIMEVNDQTLSVLQDLLKQAMSPDNTTRKNAEAILKSTEAQQGFPLLVLTLISRLIASSSPQDIAIRQSASVLFKNMVKNRWQPSEDDDQYQAISPVDKETIKTHVVELMCTVSQDVQSQLAEAVTLISKHDFPAKWTGLLPQLVNKLNTQDILVVKGVMLTANSIMKRFRYVFRSDQLYSEILHCLDGFKVPLLQQFQATGALVTTYQNQKAELLVIMETLRLMARIFFSLNWQDIPEFFEDNVAVWMGEFAKYLSYANPLLVDANEENEPGAIEQLQAAVLENLNLYATKYEEVFEPFLPQFTQLVWKLLMEVRTYMRLRIRLFLGCVSCAQGCLLPGYWVFRCLLASFTTSVHKKRYHDLPLIIRLFATGGSPAEV